MAKSNSIRILTFVAVTALSGCATCERHPVECGAIVGFVATSVALSVESASQHHSEPAAFHRCAIPRPASDTCQP